MFATEKWKNEMWYIHTLNMYDNKKEQSTKIRCNMINFGNLMLNQSQRSHIIGFHLHEMAEA